MFFRILVSFCEESSIQCFKYLTDKRVKNISKSVPNPTLKFSDLDNLLFLVTPRPQPHLTKIEATKPSPDETNSATYQTSKCFLSYLKISSIHISNHFGDSNRNVLERVAWATIFSLSIIGCAFMVDQLHQKIKMIYEDKSHENSEIPFWKSHYLTHPMGHKMFHRSDEGEPKNMTREELLEDPKVRERPNTT